MASIKFTTAFVEEIAEYDAAIAELNAKKVRLLLELLLPELPNADLDKLMDWPLIEIGVADRGMCIQLNRYVHYLPQLKFRVDKSVGVFGLLGML